MANEQMIEGRAAIRHNEKMMWAAHSCVYRQHKIEKQYRQYTSLKQKLSFNSQY